MIKFYVNLSKDDSYLKVKLFSKVSSQLPQFDFELSDGIDERIEVGNFLLRFNNSDEISIIDFILNREI